MASEHQTSKLFSRLKTGLDNLDKERIKSRRVCRSASLNVPTRPGIRGFPSPKRLLQNIDTEGRKILNGVDKLSGLSASEEDFIQVEFKHDDSDPEIYSVLGDTEQTLCSSETESDDFGYKAHAKMFSRLTHESPDPGVKSIMSVSEATNTLLKSNKTEENSRKKQVRDEKRKKKNGMDDTYENDDLKDDGFYIDMTEIEPRSGKLNRKNPNNISDRDILLDIPNPNYNCIYNQKKSTTNPAAYMNSAMYNSRQYNGGSRKVSRSQSFTTSRQTMQRQGRGMSSVQSSPTVPRNTHVQGVQNEEEKADSKRKSTAHVQRSASSVSAFRMDTTPTCGRFSLLGSNRMNVSRFNHLPSSSAFRPVERNKNSILLSSADFSSLPYIIEPEKSKYWNSSTELNSVQSEHISSYSVQSESRLFCPSQPKSITSILIQSESNVYSDQQAKESSRMVQSERSSKDWPNQSDASSKIWGSPNVKSKENTSLVILDSIGDHTYSPPKPFANKPQTFKSPIFTKVNYCSTESPYSSSNSDYSSLSGQVLDSCPYTTDYMSLPVQESTKRVDESVHELVQHRGDTSSSSSSNKSNRSSLASIHQYSTLPSFKTSQRRPINQKTVELANYAKQYEGFQQNRRIRSNSREGVRTLQTLPDTGDRTLEQTADIEDRNQINRERGEDKKKREEIISQTYSTLPRQPTQVENKCTEERQETKSSSFYNSALYTRSLPRTSRVSRGGWYRTRGDKSEGFMEGRTSVDQLIRSFEGKSESDWRNKTDTQMEKAARGFGNPGKPPRPGGKGTLDVSDQLDTSLDRSNNNQFYSLNTVSSLEQSSSPWGTWGRRKVPPVVAPKPGKGPPATPPLGSIKEGGGSLRYSSTSPWSTTSRSRDIWNLGITDKNIEEEKKLEDVWNNKEEPSIDQQSVWKKEEDRKVDQEEERRREDGVKSEEICESLVKNPPNFWMDKSLNLSKWIDSSSTNTSPQHISINQHQHTHSDSGLSSLSGSLRTAMTSPLSTVSSSSNSSSKSNSRRSSSSHRSASNLSFVTVEEAIKEFDGNLQNEEEECSCPPESSSDENPNEVYRLPESPVNRNQTYEYRRCSESNSVLKIGPNSWIGGKLREFLGWKEIDGSQEAAICCVKTKVVRLEESLIKLRYENEQVNSYFYSLQSKLVKCATYNQLEKYKLHIKEIEKITSLLSSLVFRKEKLKKGLEREKDYLEMHGFESKLEQVEERINEANCLKKNIEKRNTYILEYLENYLNYSELQDYKENLNLKMNLVREIRKIENDLNSGNEILVLITNIKNL